MPINKETAIVFVPFLGDFFSIVLFNPRYHRERHVFVPFLGDFFSIIAHLTAEKPHKVAGFRPLSRGLFFNRETVEVYEENHGGFRPLSRGLFFNNQADLWGTWKEVLFSSPFSGTFFQYNRREDKRGHEHRSFRPLSRGLFFNTFVFFSSIVFSSCFRPLSRGLFFNLEVLPCLSMITSFRPLSRGLFFNEMNYLDKTNALTCFRPLSRGLFFNSVPAKPQPVCSRERIRGGDGWVASSGTLLRR